MDNKIIVALDGFETMNDLFNLVHKLDTSITHYKIGLEAFIKFGGMTLVDNLNAFTHKKVFLDLKIEDIPETVTLAVKALAGKVEFTTLRGDHSVIYAAVQGLFDAEAKLPILLWVPILSSQKEEFTLPHNSLMATAPFGGIITSGTRIKYFRERFPDTIIVAPGIRMEMNSRDDHAFSTTPENAIKWGADYLVVGRPITKAADPVAAVKMIQERIGI